MVEPVERSDPAAGGAIKQGLASSHGSQERVEETEPFGGKLGAWRGIVERTSVAIVVISAGGDVSYASPAAERILGRLPGSFADVVTPVSLGQVSAWLDEVRAAAPERRVYFETTIHCEPSRAIGESERHIELVGTNLLGDPDVAGIVIDLADVTGRWQQAAELTRRAFYDPLTALPNRMLMADRHAMAAADRWTKAFGMPTWRCTPPRAGGATRPSSSTEWSGRKSASAWRVCASSTSCAEPTPTSLSAPALTH